MQAQHNLASVLREVEAGYEVGITRRRVGTDNRDKHNMLRANLLGSVDNRAGCVDICLSVFAVFSLD